MATETSNTNLTAAEVRALADRLQARATSTFAVGAPSQQGDGLLASAALVHLITELQELRAEVARAAASCSDDVTARALRDALTKRRGHHRGVVSVRFD
jgi:hypothetical protein